MMRRHPLLRTIALLLSVSLAGSPAFAENADLERARTEYEELNYEKARDALVAALESGDSGPAEVREILRLRGEVEVALNNPTGAEMAFVTLLAIDENASLPPRTSPKIVAPFEAARRKLGSKRLVLEAQPRGNAIIVEVTDPLRLTRTVDVTWRVPGGTPQTVSRPGGDGRIEVPVPSSGRVQAMVAALDEHGNRLIEVGREKPLVVGVDRPAPVAVDTENPLGGDEPEPTHAAPRPAGDTPQADEPEPAPPIYARWYLWGGLAVLAGGAGAYFGWEAKRLEDELASINENSMAHTYAEAQAVEDDARKNALIANVSFAAAGTLAIVSGVLLWRELRSSRRPRETAILAPVPTRGGAAVSLSLRF